MRGDMSGLSILVYYICLRRLVCVCACSRVRVDRVGQASVLFYVSRVACGDGTRVEALSPDAGGVAG